MSNFDFDKASSSELANTVARIYKINLACGGTIDEKIESII